MKIGYDAKRAFFNMTGLGNYSRGVIKAMSSLFPENKYYLYTPKIVANPRVEFINRNNHIIVIAPENQRFAALWRSKFVVKDLKVAGIQIYHGLSQEIPIGIHNTGIKSIVTIHDLIYKRFPQYFDWPSRLIYSRKIRYACRHADKIIAISERTKLDLVEILNVEKEKIEVIYQDCDPIFKVKQSDQTKIEIRTKYSLPERYILSVGTIEERKNLLLLIQALRLLPRDTKIVIVGKETVYAQLIKNYIQKHALTNQISFLTNVPLEDLPSLYQLAAVFVYPSLYEGFGIPIIEALVSGTPVVAATGSCLEEAGGPDSLYTAPNDYGDLADKIRSVLNSEALRARMIAKGYSHAQKFEDKVLATQLMDLYTKVVNHVE
jgi:glycosyltransferase involved in cell wall biosynthesis